MKQTDSLQRDIKSLQQKRLPIKGRLCQRTYEYVCEFDQEEDASALSAFWTHHGTPDQPFDPVVYFAGPRRAMPKEVMLTHMSVLRDNLVIRTSRR